jgi:hypothetical protein
LYFSLLLFVRIEKNKKIYNTLQWYSSQDIVREKLFSFYPENTYLFVCGVRVAIKIVQHHSHLAITL